MDNKTPFDIAREAIKQLSARKLPPTPANYQACYNEIARLPNVAGFPEAPLRLIAAKLPVKTAHQREGLTQLEAAIGKRSWQCVQQALTSLVSGEPENPDNGETETADTADSQPSPETNASLAALLRLMQEVLPVLGNQDARLSRLLNELQEALTSRSAEHQDVAALLTTVGQRMTLAVEEESEIRQTLLRLLQLIIQNVGELSLDGQCLQGQIDALVRAVAPPLSLRRLDEVERRLRDVLARQHAAKERALEAQEAMRQMLAGFIDQLAMMNQTSSAFQLRLEQSARELAEAKTIEDLAPLLQQVIDATRTMADDTGFAREQIESLQTRALATEAELARLHEELQHASASARHDPMTDTLNRRGLDEALAREIASVRRKTAPLALALLDVDNFKKLNDRLGHAIGDDALLHLVQVVRQNLRPIDTLARYGGEEFVILMPDTTQAEGIEAMKRLQRELTRNFFLGGNERILITFSAGVAQLTPEDTGEDAIGRADQAMYLAKRAGKNRVMAG